MLYYLYFLPEPQHLHCLLALEDQGAAHHLSIVGMGQEAAGLHNSDSFLYQDRFLQLSLSFSRFFYQIWFCLLTDPCQPGVGRHRAKVFQSFVPLESEKLTRRRAREETAHSTHPQR